MAAGATYEPIATQTVAVAATAITFSSIAASWTDLRLVLVPTTTVSGTVKFTINGDTASNYSNTFMDGNGSTTRSLANTGSTGVTIDAYNLSTTIPYLFTIDLFSYAGSTYKTFLYTSQEDQNGSGEVARGVGLWRSTAAITSLTLTISAANTFAIGTTATLYGILKA